MIFTIVIILLIPINLIKTELFCILASAIEDIVRILLF